MVNLMKYYIIKWRSDPKVTEPMDVALLVGLEPGTFDNFDGSAWQEAFELTLLSFIRSVRAVIPHMEKNGGRGCGHEEAD